MKKVGNMIYRPNTVIPLEWPEGLWLETIEEVEHALGRPRRPREVEFMAWLYFALQRGEIPGPTQLNRSMGWKQNGGQTNMLSGPYAMIRRIAFTRAGLIEPDAANPRWRWPNGWTPDA